MNSFPKRPTRSFSDIPIEYQSAFRYALMDMIRLIESDMVGGKYFLLSESVKEAVRITHKSFSPKLPATVILATYLGLSKIASQYFRDAMYFVTSRETIGHDLAVMVFCTREDYDNFKFNAPKSQKMISSNRNVRGSLKAYKEEHKINLDGILNALENDDG